MDSSTDLQSLSNLQLDWKETVPSFETFKYIEETPHQNQNPTRVRIQVLQSQVP
jgi:hypothetical protein